MFKLVSNYKPTGDQPQAIKELVEGFRAGKGLIKYVGVMLIGTMEVLTDQDSKTMIWKKGDTLFYKNGVTDPDYCVLKFTANKGRYYCDLKTESFDISPASGNSIQQIEKEQMERLKKKAKAGKLMLDE